MVEFVPEKAGNHALLGRGLIAGGHIDEAESSLRRCLELDSTNEFARRNLKDIEYQKKHRRDPVSLERWPSLISDFEDLEHAIHTYVLGELKNVPKILGKTIKVVTLGSCFAANVAHALNNLGVEARTLTIGEEINSSYANRYFIDWVTRNPNTNATPETLAKIGKIIGGNRENCRKDIENANILVYTFGVAPCFFDHEGKFFLAKGSRIGLQRLANEYEFRMTSVEENVENILAIIDAVHALRPDIHIVLSLSPVPLALTFKQKSAVLADCLSKSTLRVAIESVCREAGDGVYYWPSFEIVRWLGAYVGGMYGAEDGTTSHISEGIISTIMKLFIEVFGDQSMIHDRPSFGDCIDVSSDPR
jgi:hypothetical protein